jgi:hypothetical protein
LLLAPDIQRRPRSRAIQAMTTVIEAFQEALEMRRMAHRIYFLRDE